MQVQTFIVIIFFVWRKMLFILFPTCIVGLLTVESLARENSCGAAIPCITGVQFAGMGLDGVKNVPGFQVIDLSFTQNKTWASFMSGTLQAVPDQAKVSRDLFSGTRHFSFRCGFSVCFVQSTFNAHTTDQQRNTLTNLRKKQALVGHLGFSARAQIWKMQAAWYLVDQMSEEYVLF